MPAIRHPETDTATMANPAYKAEVAVFHRLADTLPADVHVFWSVQFPDAQQRTNPKPKRAPVPDNTASASPPARPSVRVIERELDIVILAPGTGVLVIEVKGGLVSLPADASRPATTNGAPIGNPLHQAKDGAHALARFMRSAGLTTAKEPPPVDWLAVLPTTPRPRDRSMGLAADRVVYAEDLPRLPALIIDALHRLRGDATHPALLDAQAIAGFAAAVDGHHAVRASEPHPAAPSTPQPPEPERAPDATTTRDTLTPPPSDASSSAPDDPPPGQRPLPAWAASTSSPPHPKPRRPYFLLLIAIAAAISAVALAVTSRRGSFEDPTPLPAARPTLQAPPPATTLPGRKPLVPQR